MEQEEKTKKKKAEKSYNVITSRSELNQFLSKIKEDTWLSIDLETTSVKTMEAEIVGLSFSIEQDSGIYIPIRHKDKSSQYFGENELEEVITLVKPVLENPRIPKTGQNVKYDVLILNRFGIQVKGIEFDTMIAAHLLQPGSRSYKLDKLSEEYLNYTMVPIDQLIGTGKNQISMAEVGLEDIAFYAVEDADIALQLTHVLKKRLEKENLWEFYSKVELPLIQVLTEMECRGTYVQKDLLENCPGNILNKLNHWLLKFILCRELSLTSIPLSSLPKSYLIFLNYRQSGSAPQQKMFWNVSKMIILSQARFWNTEN